ncbi:tyrosine-type recombinase/integrase [Thermogemmatispora sp.]|uniref:tyrosine-type recombinase/integrase n=1 Tax=Thermogemmatispora sp. TaxID=1968838 RepID=UPI001DCE4FE9|nr:site-specific integrase [Thermogemmatispora sp.]MBX5449961.1 site-specific integrase [Thermogemmatispora sp.]
MHDDSQKKQPAESGVREEPVVVQTGLFPGTMQVVTQPADPREVPFPPLIRTQPLTEQSSLAACALPYQQELKLRGKSNYTITCFLSDLKMFTEFMGPETPVGRITKEDLVDWLMKLKFGNKDHTPAPKTMARRVTFLKNFFSWLAREGVIREDPSASLILERPLPPLPELLFEEEIERLLKAAADDARCLCLIYLTLHAGLKKEEIMILKPEHIDLSDPQRPLVNVHFPPSTGKQHRERSLALPPEFTDIVREYLRKYQHQPGETLFNCTDRNLNYILARAVKAAGIKKRVTLQLLRDTFAVRQLRAGVSFETLRERLGLSDEAWLESREKYRRLAFPA